MVDDDDGIDLLIGAGALVLVGVGVYKVLKAVGSYKTEQIISTPQARTISTYIPQSNIQRVYAYCSECGRETEQCQYEYHDGSNRCMNCNDGLGIEYRRSCMQCQRAITDD